MMNRRQFARFLPALPAIALLADKVRFIPYSLGSKVHPWVGWIESKAGRLIGFVKHTGEIVRP